MNEELLENADAYYRLAEQEAAHYFESLSAQLLQKTYVAPLINDIQSWKKNHIHPNPFVSYLTRGKGKSDSMGYHNYIQWLDYTGKLDNYLDRSISYIYLRDLGKALDSPATQSSIRRTVDSIKKHLTNSNPTDHVDKMETFSMAGLYRMAQKEGVESAMIWVMDKLKTVSSNIPKGMDAEEAKRKLIKIIAGVILHEVEEMDAEITPKERTRKLDKAIRLGYSYGLTYPFIDDLMDANVLSNQEKKQYSELIRTTLITESVPELEEWTGKNAELIRFIHSELREAFEYIKALQRSETGKAFLRAVLCFFQISGS